MRRTEREITDRKVLDDILHRASVVYLGLSDDGIPYVVPMNFGYDGTALYLHSAREGRKVEILEKNPRVCFAVSLDDAVITGETACQGTAKYRSVIGYGHAQFLQTPEEKRHGLDIFMNTFAEGPFHYQDGSLNRTLVIRIEVEEITGKQA